MRKKLSYEKPSLEVLKLEQQPQLLTGSGLGKPANYPGSGDPFGA